MGHIEIIKAETDHFDRLYDLMCELENCVMDKQSIYRVYSNNIKNKDIYYFFAASDSEIVGFASLHIQQLLHHASRIGELQEIIVNKSKQGLGIGSVLFNHIMKISIEQGCSQLEVCCNQEKKESHKFYLKQGMKNSHYKFTLEL